MRKRYLVLGLSVFLALALAVPALGGPSNPVAGISASAKKTAKKALKKAKNAQNTANNAQNAANGAQNSADDAAAAAANAQTTADGAQTSATNAQTAADAAQASANTKFDQTRQVTGDGTALDSTAVKTDNVLCDGTDESLVGGGHLTGGAGANDATPTDSFPYLTLWTVTSAENTAGTAETWDLTAAAICASP